MVYIIPATEEQQSGKYLSLITGLSSQYYIDNNQYTLNITDYIYIMNNYFHDNYRSQVRSSQNYRNED